jgi:hypothetical protein
MEISDIFAEVGRLHLEVSELNKLITELRAKVQKMDDQNKPEPPKP